MKTRKKRIGEVNASAPAYVRRLQGGGCKERGIVSKEDQPHTKGPFSLPERERDSVANRRAVMW